MSNDAEMETPPTTAELMARIDESWQAFRQAINQLSQEQLTQVRDNNDWTVKDHLAHIRAWEQSLVALLEGRDRNAAVGIESTGEHEIDDINAQIRQQSQGQSLAEVQQALDQSHQQVVEVVGRLSDTDLRKPYSFYQPPLDDDTDPVVGWIIGNTYDHYDEHIGWIKALLNS